MRSSQGALETQQTRIMHSCIPEDAHSLFLGFQIQAGRMHLKLGKAHKQDMMPAMQMDGLQKYPMLQDVPEQKNTDK